MVGGSGTPGSDIKAHFNTLAPNIQALIRLRFAPGMQFVTAAIIMVLVGSSRTPMRGAVGICNRLEERSDDDWGRP